MDNHGLEADDDDPIVRELDVYACNEMPAAHTLLTTLGYPLRAPWRPYRLDQVPTLRMKPRAKRMEMVFPLDTSDPTYNRDMDDGRRVKEMLLRSTLVEARASYAVGMIKDNKLLLAPIDYALQLRPTLPHLDKEVPPAMRTIAGAAGGAGGKKGRVKSEGNDRAGEGLMDGDSDDGGGGGEGDEELPPEPPPPKATAQAVEVQVTKRETERQQQARLNSYAYISSKEDEEEWVHMALHHADGHAAASISDAFICPKDNDVPAARGTLDRPTYLRSVVPCMLGIPEAGGNGLANGAGNGLANGNGVGNGLAGVGVLGGDASALSAGAAACLVPAFHRVLREHGVMTMGNVRTWLDMQASVSTTTATAGKPAPPAALAVATAAAAAVAAAAKEASSLSDRALHDIIVTGGRAMCIRRCYVLCTWGDEKLDPFRALLLELLKDKDTFKKSELMELAALRTVQATEAMFNKVVKDICMSKGNAWVLKNGADGL